MKGLKTMSLANGTAERFHADKLMTQDAVISETLLVKELDVYKVLTELKKQNEELVKQVKELKDKVDTFEVSE
jgi:hypothetical protein